MKGSNFVTALIIPLFIISLQAKHLLAQETITPELKEKAVALAEAYGQAYRAKSIDQVMGLFDPELGEEALATYAAAFQEIFERDFVAVDSSVREIKPTRTRIAVKVALVEGYPARQGKQERQPRRHILFTKRHDDRLLVREFAEEILGGDFNSQTRTYRSTKGRYSVAVPAGWTPVEAPADLSMIVPEPVCLLAPDLESLCILGFVQLPIKMTLEEAVKLDVDAAKRLVEQHTLVGEGPTRVGEFEAYYAISEFSEKGLTEEEGMRRRMRLYFSSPPMLYFFIFDVLPPEQFDALKPDFDAIVESFSVLPTEGGQTAEEAVAEHLAHGSVQGRVYTNEEFNCFIAAPEGWEIRTSPNPAHLVEMQYTGGKSIARLLAARGLPPEPDILKKTFERRLQAVKAIVEDFNEISRRDVTIHEVPAIESIHTYSLKGLGGLHIKEVTIVQDGVYYLILCQAIEPDSFDNLEPDFDEIIGSFGFIQ